MNKHENKGKKYINSILWFSALWAIKEFVLEPMISKSKKQEQNNDRAETYKQIP